MRRCREGRRESASVPATNFDPEINFREFVKVWTWIDRQWREYPTHAVKRTFEFPVVGEQPVYLNGHDELHSLSNENGEGVAAGPPRHLPPDTSARRASATSSRAPRTMPRGRCSSSGVGPRGGVMEIEPGSDASFDGTVRDLTSEIESSTATVTVSAADPMIAVRTGPSTET